MKKIFKIISFVLISSILVKFYFAGQKSATMYAVKGLVNDELAVCESKPNCVSSTSKDKKHWIESFEFDTDPFNAMNISKIVMKKQGIEIVEQNKFYIHGIYTSSIFKFVDDIEIHIDIKKSLINFRSASRVGYSDLGANRRRIEKIRKELIRIMKK